MGDGEGGSDLSGFATGLVDPSMLEGGGGGGTTTLPDPGFTPSGSDFGPGENPFMMDTRGSGDRGAGTGLYDFAAKLGGGLEKEFTDSPLGALTKTLGIGGAGLSFMNQRNAASQMKDATSAIRKSTAAAQAAAAPAVAAGTADITRAQQGKLQPAMEAGIAQWEQEAVAAVQAKYASMGLGNSSDVQSEVNKIRLMAQSMRGNLLQSEEAQGGQLIGTGVNAATGGGQLAVQQEQILANLIAAANQQLGLLGGRSGGQA